MRRVIGLVGYKQSGKSTTLKYLEQILVDKNVVEMKNAQRLKEACAKAFGLSFDHFESQDLKEQRLCVPMIFSKKVADIIADMFNLGSETPKIYCHLGKEFFTPREALQYIGTEVLRVIDRDIHCKMVKELAPRDGLVVISDNRFPSELTYHKKHFGEDFVTVYIQNDKASEIAKKDGELHESESYIETIGPECDYTLSNNGDLAELKQNIESLIKSLSI